LSTASSEPVFAGGGRVRPLVVRRSALARRMRLTIDPRDGQVTLVLPLRASQRRALAWVEEKRGWIETTLGAMPAPTALGHGATLPFEGKEVRIFWEADGPRKVILDGDLLLVGGPADQQQMRWLRAEALARLEPETRDFAARANVGVGRVGVGDPKSRWGSCSAAGDIRYSWRLVMAPPAVREATVAHEVAHRLHMDHGPAFHRAVAELLGREPKAERAWLRAHGGRLQTIGRE
jgi:predicted metal-dependent hydrolase